MYDGPKRTILRARASWSSVLVEEVRKSNRFIRKACLSPDKQGRKCNQKLLNIYSNADGHRLHLQSTALGTSLRYPTIFLSSNGITSVIMPKHSLRRVCSPIESGRRDRLSFITLLTSENGRSKSNHGNGDPAFQICIASDIVATDVSKLPSSISRHPASTFSVFTTF